MPGDAIATHGLSKSFRGRPAIHDVNLVVDRGSVYAFLGPNGAGKSTTIRLLLGLLRPSAGQVSLFGLPLAGHRGEILARVGSLVESPSLYPHLTARENLEIVRRILGAPGTDVDRVLGVVGLENRGRHLVKTYSLGMKQRLGLAQALLGRRELLLLDEPMNGLDPAGMTDLRNLIRRLPTDHGVTVLLSSHLLSEVDQVATHVGILSQGALVFQGRAGQLAELRRSRLRIGVNRLDAAIALLASRGWHADRVEEFLYLDTVSEAAVINRALVDGGLDVHHLAVESATLEDVFLGMTQAEVR